MAKKETYTGKDIKVLGGLEGVRKRPSMYIGSTSKEGLHHLVYEVVDNAVDECLAGHCKIIDVVIHKDNSVTVKDDGRGIPVEKNKKHKKSALELVMTKLHAGGKFEHKAYAISGGLHGVGVSVVNALSRELKVEVRRGGKKYRQKYKRGKPETKVKKVGKAKGEGTEITFKPDNKIFTKKEFDFKTLATRFREIAFLNAGLTIKLKDEKKKKKEKFHYSGGLVEFVKWLNKDKEKLFSKPIYFKKKSDSVVIEVAVQYNNSYRQNIYGFVNTINTVEGGTHISGFKSALTRCINDYAKKENILKKGSLSGNDVREGITAVVSIKIPEPQFEGQTKTKLGNSEVKGLVNSFLSSALSDYLQENPKTARAISKKAAESAKARNAAKKARDLVRRKSSFGSGGLPGKLADCSSRKKEKSELYIVEGESAAGCFSGDTKVALADGRNLSFKKLVKENKKGKENFCYTIKENGSVGIQKIKNPRRTKKEVKVIKVILDNDQKIICTPDHKFMLRDGTYKEAQNLSKKDSLMPFHKRISKKGAGITIEGYEMVWDQNKTWIFTHMLADQYNLENNIYTKNEGSHKHHIDFDKRNNNPSNIIRMPKEKHIKFHSNHAKKILHSEEVKEKSRQAHKNEEYRKKLSKRMKRADTRKKLSKNSRKLWQDDKFKEYMKKKWKEYYESNEEYRKKVKKRLKKEQEKYWSNPKNRKKASERVKNFFEKNPEIKEHLSKLAKKQWENEDLLEWRSEKTKEQWTKEFRRKRMESYNKTYYRKTIKFMKKIFEKYGNLENFREARIGNGDRSILSKNTFCKRFFNENPKKMIETVQNYNHKIKSIEKLNKRMDVYDLEVEKTHNFALSSGIFVHNSSKQARDRKTQAILPIKGKILNVEKATPVKILSNDEITNLITAIGTGVREEFNIEKLRYGKIIINTDADVDGQHILTLLLTFFYRTLPELIENGHLYIAVSPLYKVRKKKDHYVYSEKELKKLKTDKSQITRFKGLGEMSPQQLWKTTMNPKKRILKKVTIDDAVEVDRVFTTLMGKKVQPRKEFIMEKADEALLDI